MIWSAFKDGVKGLLPVDKSRVNVGVSNDAGEPWLDRLIRQGVIDIQRHIPCYRAGHESTYTEAEVTQNCKASIGILPDQAFLRDAWHVSTEANQNCLRQPLRYYPWDSRYDLICGVLRIVNCQLAIAIDPQRKQFIAFPAVEADTKIVITWDGMKFEFVDGDTVPFDEGMQLAVADFAKSYIAREVEKDLPAHDSYAISYKRNRLMLLTDCKARGMFENMRDSVQPDPACAPCSPCTDQSGS